jgi:hypothetical protein
VEFGSNHLEFLDLESDNSMKEFSNLTIKGIIEGIKVNNNL